MTGIKHPGLRDAVVRDVFCILAVQLPPPVRILQGRGGERAERGVCSLPFRRSCAMMTPCPGDRAERSPVMYKRYRPGVLLFLTAEAVLYGAFLWRDLERAGPSASSTPLKYAAILLCALFAGLWALFGGGDRLTALALVLTGAADTFLLELDAHYAAGVLLFCGVQLCYFLRLYPKKRPESVGGPAGAVPAVPGGAASPGAAHRSERPGPLLLLQLLVQRPAQPGLPGAAGADLLRRPVPVPVLRPVRGRLSISRFPSGRGFPGCPGGDVAVLPAGTGAYRPVRAAGIFDLR